MSRNGAALLILAAAVLYRFANAAYVNPDSLGYFAYLPALVHRASLDFSFELKNLSDPLVLTKTHLIGNFWECGAAVLWLPFYLLGELVCLLAGRSPAEGFSALLRLFVNCGSYVYGLAALWLIYDALGLLGLRRHRFLAAGVVLLGTPLLFYMTEGASLAHATSAFAVALFCWRALKTGRHSSPRAWAGVGLLGGLMAVVRPQNAAYLLLLGPVAGRRADWPKLCAALAGVLFGSLPQLLIWKCVYGDFLAFPKLFNLVSSRFALGEVLFSPFHGLLFWTPAVLLCVLGFAHVPGAQRRTVRLLGALVVVQLLIAAKAEAWWNGFSFGNRYLADSALPLAVGMGTFLNHESKQVRRVSIIVACAAALWTCGLFVNHLSGALSLGDFEPAERIVHAQTRLFLHPWSALRTLLVLDQPFKGLWTIMACVAAAIVSLARSLRPRLEPCALVLVAAFLALTLRAYSGTKPASWPARPEQVPLTSDELGAYITIGNLTTEAGYLERTGRNVEAIALRNEVKARYQGTDAWRERVRRGLPGLAP